MERSASARRIQTLRSRWPHALTMLGCTCLAVLASVRPAWGAAGQWQAGARLGVAWLDGAGLGPAAESQLRRGLGESLDVDLQLMTSFHPDASHGADSTGGDATRAWALAIAPGLLYRWDALRVVPFGGLSAGLYALGGQLEPELKGAGFGVSARAGVDYLLSRDVVLSVQLSAHALGADDGLRLPWFQLGLGAAHAWGW